MKVKTKDLKELREKMAASQNNLCGLCGEPLTGNNHLDHHHGKGYLRSVLHSGCNMGLGKVENMQAINQIPDLVKWLRQAADYLEHHQSSPSELLHPTFFTPEERKQRAKKRAKKNRKLNTSKKIITKE